MANTVASGVNSASSNVYKTAMAAHGHQAGLPIADGPAGAPLSGQPTAPDVGDLPSQETTPNNGNAGQGGNNGSNGNHYGQCKNGKRDCG
ncbi:hypothetical protein [Croceicoccus naphthovorans]|nr:hypothetical protein [Croceicoccus naphthovorans]